MYESVEETEEGAVTTGGEFNSEPDGRRHDAVMDDVEGRDVTVLLSQHEEDRVRELGELGDVVPPAAPRHAHR